MKKKLFALILTVSICFGLCSCTGKKYEQAEKTNFDFGCGYFVVIEKWGDMNEGNYAIVYAKDTKVKYIVWASGYKGSITPLYNADGTLQIYEESEE